MLIPGGGNIKQGYKHKMQQYFLSSVMVPYVPSLLPSKYTRTAHILFIIPSYIFSYTQIGIKLGKLTMQ